MKKLFTLLFVIVATTALWAEDFEVNGIYYTILTDKTNEVEVTYGSSYYSGSIAIPSTVTYNGTTYSVTSIGDYAFLRCYGLTSITIPNSVTSIGKTAFFYCYGLTSITIPNSVMSIGDYAFSDCYGLTSVTIGNSVTSVGNSAFAYCYSLTSITIPNSVTSIGDGVFYKCSSLTSIVVEEGNSIYDSRDNCNAIIKTATNTLIIGCQNTTIPNSVTSIGDYAFADCYGLTSITIPESVTSIGEDAFAFCSGLTSIIVEDTNSTYDSRDNCNAIIETATNTLVVGCQTTIIPNSVTSIGSGAFYGCSGLTSITIPNSVMSIGDYAFAFCSGLTSITSLAEIPPTLGRYAFYNVSTKIPVYVCSVSAYQSAEGWKDFTNIQCMPEDESAVDNVHSQSANVQKIFRDGQLLIIRDGKTYNAQGVEL